MCSTTRLLSIDRRPTETPNVRAAVVAGLNEHFGRHEVGTTDERVPLLIGVAQLTGHAEIGQFGAAAVVQEDVSGFDVSMNLLLQVKILESPQSVVENRL